MYICTTTVARVYHILLISHFVPFFLCLLCAKQIDFSPQSSSSFSLDTHKHKHTHTQTQTHPQTNHHRGCLVLVLCPRQALRVELPSYEDEFDLVGQGSEYSKGAVDFGSKSKETQRRRGVSWTEEEHMYKILIVFLFWG